MAETQAMAAVQATAIANAVTALARVSEPGGINFCAIDVPRP